MTPADDAMRLTQAEYYIKQDKVGEAERIAAYVGVCDCGMFAVADSADFGAHSMVGMHNIDRLV